MTTPLEGWENFYVIVGSSAGALIGLQFVVITLIAGAPVGRREAQAAAAFASPSVVHFGVVLLLSALVCAPWHSLVPVGILWALLGLYGIGYSLVVVRRLRTQTLYDPVFEDWLFHALLPLTAYAALLFSAAAVHYGGRPVLFVVAGAALLLLYIGIHNAWDTVIYHVFARRKDQSEGESSPSPLPKERGPG